MQWFGDSWGAPVCAQTEHVAAPVGKICVECKREIGPDDSGFILPYIPYPPQGRFTEAYYHRDCFLDTLLGDGSRHYFRGEVKQ